MCSISVYAAEAESSMEVDLVRRRALRDGHRPPALRLSDPRRKGRQREVRRSTLASHHFRASHVHSR